MNLTDHPTRTALDQACTAVGLDPAGATVLRAGSNIIWQLPDSGLIARIGNPGTDDIAERELNVARWLADVGIPAVRPAPGIDQPAKGDGLPVTFWLQLPPHRDGTVTEVAAVLRRIHQAPTLAGLPRMDPVEKTHARIDRASVLTEEERAWLHGFAEDLADAWRELPSGMPWCVVHGDAWPGNLAVTDDGTPYVLDLENTTVGPPEWDLTSTAVKLTSTSTITAREYDDFCETYGADVTAWDGYPILRSIRELRVTTFAAQVATSYPHAVSAARHRLDCLRGRNGPRPWRWSPVP